MMISGEVQNPLKCLSNLGEIWNDIVLVFYSFIQDFPSLYNRCDRTKILANYAKKAEMARSLSPHKLRHFLFTWLKKQGLDDALIQPYSGHESRQSLEIYSKLSLADSQEAYNEIIGKFPIK